MSKKKKIAPLKGTWQPPAKAKKRSVRKAPEIHDFLFGDDPDTKPYEKTKRPPVVYAEERFPVAKAASLKKKSKTKLVEEIIRLQTLVHACACTCALACKGKGHYYIHINPEASVRKILIGKEFENLT